MIIHQRGSNDNNLLVMEFKTYWNKDQKKDIEKIEAFLENGEKDSYNYKYGIAVLIDINKVDLKMYDKFENEFLYSQDF